ncbi:hypothetical protein [Nocardia jejuensis]|uniref:hypothetical protein n=1 Tax=Nocardia jejuensis TaxID=328049 RepID=UPI000830584A|nr:hypothetical protein [Nocardia jejuensis]
MTISVLLLGLTAVVVDEARERIDLPDIEFHSGTGLADLRAVFAQGPVDHVIMGAGLDLGQRLSIVREIFETSDTTTVHLKDRASGPDAFLPFVRAVLTGLRGP